MAHGLHNVACDWLIRKPARGELWLIGHSQPNVRSNKFVCQLPWPILSVLMNQTSCRGDTCSINQAAVIHHEVRSFPQQQPCWGYFRELKTEEAGGDVIEFDNFIKSLSP